jgi:negative regulator of sigma E activity
MRLRKREVPMDSDVERELATIDAGLAGAPVPPDAEDLAALARDVRAERSAPDAGFAARLDERAREGFPRRAGDERGAVGLWQRLRERLEATPPRRMLAPVGAAATLLVAVAVAIGVSDQLGGSGGGTEQAAPAPGAPSEALSAPPNRAPGAGNATAGRAAATFGGLAHRKVAKNADLVLSTEPNDVRSVADGVVQVVDRYRGFVVRSHVTSGRPQPAPIPLQDGAAPSQPLPSGTFELRIPAGSLKPALGDLSALAHVTSRTESLRDITSRFNASAQAVQDLEAQRDQLLKDLAEALTPEERDSINARLHVVENQLAAARHALARVQQRVHLVPVSVEILAQRGIDVGGGGGDGSWDIGNALHDAGRVLIVIAGVLLISLAVLGPVALLAALGWLGGRAFLRLRRERALD